MGFSNGHFTTGQSNTVLWQSGIVYALNDIVVYNGTHYICTSAHTGASDFQDDLDAGRWLSFNRDNINYIANGDAQVGSTGYSTYKDAASSVPVDGTGGTAGLTFTSSTSNPLRNTRSFILTTTAVNLQGEGVSYDFVIDAADRAKVLTISFDYTSDVVFSDGDFVVYIYDITNAQMIQPTAFRIGAVTSGFVNNFISTFQTASNSSSYRLIIHRAVTTAQAINLKFDNVKVSPQSQVRGAPVTDWVSYNLVIGATTTAPTLGSVTANNARWRRIGDSIEISYVFFQTSGGTNGTGTYLFPLPSGFVADTNKIRADTDWNVASHLGGAKGYSVATNTIDGHVYLYNTTNIAITLGNTISTTQPVGSSFMGLGAATITYSFTARVPIAGWSSNVSMSSDIETRVVAAKLTKASQGSITSGGVWNTVSFASGDVSSDTHASWSAVNNEYTVPVSGNYVFRVTCRNNSTTAGDYIIIGYRIDGGSEVIIGQSSSVSGVAFGAASGSDQRFLNAGQKVQMRVITGSSTTINNPAFSIERVSGTQTIAANEVVNLKYRTSANTSLTSASTITFTPNTQVYDSHAAYNTSNGQITIPTSGEYEFLVHVAMATGSVATMRIQYEVNNVAIDDDIQFKPVETTFNQSHQIAVFRDRLRAGDVVRFRFTHWGGVASLTGDSRQNFIAMSRVG